MRCRKTNRLQSSSLEELRVVVAAEADASQQRLAIRASPWNAAWAVVARGGTRRLIAPQLCHVWENVRCVRVFAESLRHEVAEVPLRRVALRVEAVHNFAFSEHGADDETHQREHVCPRAKTAYGEQAHRDKVTSRKRLSLRGQSIHDILHVLAQNAICDLSLKHRRVVLLFFRSRSRWPPGCRRRWPLQCSSRSRRLLCHRHTYQRTPIKAPSNQLRTPLEQNAQTNIIHARFVDPFLLSICPSGPSAFGPELERQLKQDLNAILVKTPPGMRRPLWGLAMGRIQIGP